MSRTTITLRTVTNGNDPVYDSCLHCGLGFRTETRCAVTLGEHSMVVLNRRMRRAEAAVASRR